LLVGALAGLETFAQSSHHITCRLFLKPFLTTKTMNFVEKQREIMIKWLCADIYNPDGAINTKESILSNLNLLLSSFY